MYLKSLMAFGSGLIIASSVPAAVFTVTNTNYAGAGSLQQAILDANGSPGADVIAFNLAPGSLSIAPTNPLPALTDPVTIDGSTQPGYNGAPLIEISGVSAGSSANGLVISSSNCVVRALAITHFQGDNYYSGDGIQITNGVGNSVEGCYLGIARDGITPAGNSGAGVRVGYPFYFDGQSTSNNVVGGPTAAQRNLISANGSGIYIFNSAGNTIQGNYIGTDASGSTGLGNTNVGVTLDGSAATGNLIGGTTAGQRNLISGNGREPYYNGDGIKLLGSTANVIYGNFIGVNVTGTAAIPNAPHGVDIQFGQSNLVGGGATGQGNLISGNSVHGVNLGGSIEATIFSITPAPLPNGNIIQGNFIGTDVSGEAPLPNQSDGVYISNMSGNLVGGFLPGEGNVINYNTNNGVEITGGDSADSNEVAGNQIAGNRNIGVLLTGDLTGNAILTNSIYGNTNFGIDLNGDNATLNDDSDSDEGANRSQNFPVLGFPIQYASQTVISGSLASAADGVFTVELFDNDTPDASGYGQGQRFLAALTITNDGSGLGSFAFTNPVAMPLTHWITATATDTNGNTSEFSLARRVVRFDSIDLAVTLSGTVDPAPKSAPFAYTITVTNRGPATATGVVATNPLPAGLSLVSATSSQGTCDFSGGILSCDIGTLAAGDGVVITLNINTTNTATVTDTVQVTANESDNDLANNTASLETRFGLANLATLLSHSPEPVVAGQLVTYTVIVTNFGPDAASAAHLIFFPDANISPLSATVSQGSVSPPGSAIVCLFGIIPANSKATLIVTAIPTQSGTLYNYANADMPEVDYFFSDNNVAEATTVLDGPGVIQFSRRHYPVNEGDGSLLVGVTRAGGAIGTVTVDFATSNLTAVAGVNYVATNGTLTFLPGESDKTFRVKVLDDGLTDCNDELSLRLFNATGGAVLAGRTNAVVQIFDNHPAPSGIVQAVSIGRTNVVTTGNTVSQTPSISDDGRFVAFASYANNLVTTADFNNTSDIFVYDRVHGINSLVSLNRSNSAAADNFSTSPQISSDGQIVGFDSFADDLTTNQVFGPIQLFARPLAAGSNILVSVNTNGAAGNDYSDVFSLSDDGTKIAFRSNASDLVPGDNNGTTDVYFRDLASNAVVAVSASSSGSGTANNYSDYPRISGNGRYVVFGSYADNLSPADNGGQLDIYRRDVKTGTNELVSANTNGLAGNVGCNSDIYLSDDGRYVAFESSSTDLVPGPSSSAVQVFRRDMLTGVTVLISMNNAGAPGSDGDSTLRGISRDGLYVLFSSLASNLATNDTNFAEDIFLRDVLAGTTALVSVNQAGTDTGNSGSGNCSLTPDGRYVTFLSGASDLTANPKPVHDNDVFQRDMLTKVTTLLSTAYNSSTAGNDAVLELAASTNGVAAISSFASDLAQVDLNNTLDIFARAPGESNMELVSRGTGVTGNLLSSDQRVTADGTKVVIVSDAGNLVANDTNNASDVFLYDLASRAVTLISANAANSGTQKGSADYPSPSANGRFVAYHSEAGGVFDSAFDQIYLRDSVSNATLLVSANWTNGAPGNNASFDPEITPDGQYVVFDSMASDLVSNDVNGASSDIFIRNRTNATASLISFNAAGTGSANSDSYYPSVSADGRFVAFETYAGNFGPADHDNAFDVYVRDRQAGTNVLCSPNTSGTDGGDDDSFDALVSASGNKVVFFSDADNLATGDTNSAGDLFAFDIATRTLQLVSVNTNGIPGNGSSFNHSVSADGRYVAFYSESSDLVPNDRNMSGDIFVRDLVAGTTQLASMNCESTGSGNDVADSPQISADGRYVTFHSFATDLAPGDFSHATGSIFRRDLQTGSTVLVSRSRDLRGEGNGNSGLVDISSNGGTVSFLSTASDLIFGDANGADDAFVWRTDLAGVDLAINGVASAGTITQGDALSYTFTVTNYGLTTATSVVITNVLPAALSFVSATTSQGTFNHSGGLFTCNLGTLSVGAGARITLNTTATGAGNITNTASTSSGQSDFNLANNSASVMTLIVGLGPIPELTFDATNGSQLSFSWPYPSSGYGLETTTNLMPGSIWSPVTNAVSNNGLLNYLILGLDPQPSTRFFRLHHP